MKGHFIWRVYLQMFLKCLSYLADSDICIFVFANLKSDSMTNVELQLTFSSKLA